MPYYGRPVGTELEPVGFGFNHEVITGLLRGRFGFDGVVCTDWALVSDVPMPDGSVWEAKAWGVEELDAADRLCRIIEAGCDQLGGEHLPELLVQLVEEGRVSEARIDESARRILRDKFRLGLFDDPYVDAAAAETICGRSEFREAGAEAQRRAIVLLSNNGVLPLRSGARLFVDGLPAEAAAAYGSVVEHPADADAAIVFRHAPYEPRQGTFIESLFHAGSLEFPTAERDHILEIARASSDDPRRAPRPPRDPDRARRRVQRGRRHVRREPRGDPRPRLRCVLTDRQAPLRASLVDGCGPPSAP